MSKLGLVIMLILTAGRTYAQQYFVLIQADSSQSFYIRLGDQLYTSSPEGHLILSRLKDSSYSITIGFPGQVFPEERFSFDIHQKDQIFRLKQEDGRVWRLYDDQGLALKGLDGGESGNNKSRVAGIKKDDAFSRLMADLVRDTAVMYNTYAMQQILSDSPSRAATAVSPPAVSPPAISPPAVPADTQAAAPVVTPPPTAPPVSTPPAAVVPLYRPALKDSAVVAGPLYRPSDVVKVSEHKSARSLRLVYADHAADSKTDTIVIIIPVDTGRQAAGGGHGPNPDSPVLGSGSGPRQARPALPFVNSDCHAYATDYDLDKLRVKMLGSAKDEDRIQDARRFFKTKCFSTRQIKALTEVFTTDATKFRFLEAAYPFVSDDHFPELISLLADPVYSGRFRAMTDRQ
jgi:hypothetical protein